MLTERARAGGLHIAYFQRDAAIIAASGMGVIDFGAGPLDSGGEYSVFLGKLGR